MLSGVLTEDMGHQQSLSISALLDTITGRIGAELTGERKSSELAGMTLGIGLSHNSVRIM